MRRTTVLFLALVALLPVQPLRAELAIKDGDRVMFFSSTPLWPASFGTRVETFVRVKYPALKVRFWHWSPPANAAIEDAEQRIDRHLEAFRPTLVVLNFGLGHGRSKALQPARLDSFRADLLGLITRCEQAGARVILVTPHCPEVHQKTRLTRCKYDEVVGRYAQVVREVGAGKGLTVADWYAATADRAGHGPDGPGGSDLLTIDGLWPTALGAALGAECFLEAVGGEPLEVELQVDWATLESSATSGSISATRHDESAILVDLHGLPIPWSVSGRGRMVHPNRLGSPMCRLTLRLRNVPAGGVVISQAGRKAVAVGQQAVDDGIDLASFAPVARAKPVVDLVEQIKKKNKTLDRYERFLKKPLGQPEYAEANRKYLEAILAEAQGTARIIDRIPRTMDLTLEVRLAK